MTERNRAEAERQALEQELHQSERLESLGQLAGGIAHDFNNLLAAIMNYAGFVAEETADRPAVRADAEQIQAAAQRAARLTRQLLIFGRRDDDPARGARTSTPSWPTSATCCARSIGGGASSSGSSPAADLPAIAGRPRPGRAGAAQPGRQRPRRDARRAAP